MTPEAIGQILASHQPATGMRVASGETCRCGYWNGIERAGRDRPVGMSGLMWHQAQEIASAIADRDKQLERVREIHEPISAINVNARNGQAETQVCTGCGQDDGNWNYWPCPTIRALDGTR